MAKKPNLSRVPTVDLTRELERREAMASAFEARRDELAKELADIGAEISALEGAHSNGVGPRHVNRTSAARTRPTNQQPLYVALQKLLRGRTMSVSEAAKAVKNAGYKSNAANFTTIVNLTLLDRKDLFKRVGRGLYTVREVAWPCPESDTRATDGKYGGTPQGDQGRSAVFVRTRTFFPGHACELIRFVQRDSQCLIRR